MADVAITSLPPVMFMDPRRSTGAGGRAPAQPTCHEVRGPGDSLEHSDSSVTNQESWLPCEETKGPDQCLHSPSVEQAMAGRHIFFGTITCIY